MTLIAAMRTGGGDPVLDVETEIDPLHLYRPINNATWTTLVGGKVDLLKDNGRSGTALNLQQTTDANRYTHGTDGDGNEFMRDTTGSKFMTDVVGAVADWKFLSDGLQGVTVSMTLEIEGVSDQNQLIETSAGGSSNIGVFCRMNGSAGSLYSVYSGLGGANGTVELFPGTGENGAVGLYTFINRYRKLDEDAVTPGVANLREAEMRINGVSLIVHQPLPATYSASNPNNVLRFGALSGVTGLHGKLYELVIDDRWWSDELVRRYESRGVNVFKTGNMIR